MRHGYFLENSAHRIALGDVLFHELAPCRDIVEKVADYDGSAVGAAALLVGLLHAALYGIESAVESLFLLGHYLHTGYSGNRCKSFSAEAQSEDIVKVLLCAYLACGMTKKGFGNVAE